eukprot:CAMPEP_0196826598 /NCGR_PEP_ID=MMETSP1362-20130617/93710_1 /TAXON_ID=163516 /ORGANISM="Leptocylindrus danicus, Strain CCMP1856" /LENGTH=431 /DNA_ID=CAMNT_0042207175 /DNA_START=837 /DNA_END=2132 /DNA_ORIENTATION=-
MNTSRKCNDDTFFDPMWDDMWQTAENEILQQQQQHQHSGRSAVRELHAVEPVSIESLQQKAKASAWTRACLRTFLRKTTPQPLPDNHCEEEEEEESINSTSQHSIVTNDEHTTTSKNFEPRFDAAWSQTFDTTPLYYRGGTSYDEMTPTTSSSYHLNTTTGQFTSSSALPIEAATSHHHLDRATPTLTISDGRKLNNHVEPKTRPSTSTSTAKGHNIVDHTYVDYSLVTDEEVFKEGPLMCGTPIELLVCDGVPLYSSAKNSHDGGGERSIFKSKSNKSPLQGSRRSRATDSFPKKLHLVLSCKEYYSIITWLPHGRSFIVRDPEALAEKVFPEFFKLKKYNSFIRQLSLWGFKRMTKGMNAKSYYHPLFLRGKSALASRMTLTLIKGTGTKLKSNPDAEPNFEVLSIVRPLPDDTADEQDGTSFLAAFEV